VTVLCRSYSTHEQARRAVEALLSSGVSGAGVRAVSGEPARDAREAPEGEFGGTIGADATVGSFGGSEHDRREATGDFASAAHGQRGGSFADADREIVTSYPEGVEHMSVAGHRNVRKLLMEAGLDKQTAERDVEALHAGRILVLADIGDLPAGEGEALLDQASREQ
jgi:hypothetical protein